jgi:hypothetical protein
MCRLAVSNLLTLLYRLDTLSMGLLVRKIIGGFVRLDYSAASVQHTDSRVVGKPARPESRERDRVANRVGSRVRDRSAPKTIANQIKTIPILAETELINVVGGYPKPVLFVTLSPHSASAPFVTATP